MTRHRVLAGLIVLAVGASVLFAGCAPDADETVTPGGGAGAEPTTVHVTAAAGGTVADPGGNTTLVIPPGALAEDTDITLALLPKAGVAVSQISELGPDGLGFLLPVTLTIKGDASLAPDGKGLALAVKEGGDFVALPGSTYANGAASALIEHFSQYGLIPVAGEPDTTDGGGDDDAVGADASSADAGTADAASVDIGSADAASADTGGTDTGAADTGGTDTGSAADTGSADTGGTSLGCDPAGALPAPAPGRATILASFSDASADFNGTLEPFNGPEEFGAADGAGQSRWLSFNKQQAPNDETLRQITIAVEALPVACVPYTPMSSPSGLPYVQYFEGVNLTKQWWCGGSVIIDTIDGPTCTFHFDLLCAPSPVLDAGGTVAMSGKGAGTFN